MKYRQRQGVINSIIDGEIVIMHPDDGKVIVLNESGTYLWQLLDQWHTIENVFTTFTAVYETPQANSQNEVRHFVIELAQKGLLDVKNV